MQLLALLGQRHVCFFFSPYWKKASFNARPVLVLQIFRRAKQALTTDILNK